MTSHIAKDPAHLGEGAGASEAMSMLGGFDGEEDTKTSLDKQSPNNVSGPLTRRNAVETSSSAATVARKSHGRRCRRLYFLVKAQTDLTCEEALALLEADGENWLLTTVRARMCDLRRDGYVIQSGRRGIGESGVAKVAAWRCTSEAERAQILAGRAGKETEVPASVVSEACRRARAALAGEENVFQALVAAFTAQIMAQGGAA